MLSIEREHVKKLFNNIIKDDTVNKEVLVDFLVGAIITQHHKPEELVIIALDIVPNLELAAGDIVYVDMDKTYFPITDTQLMLDNDRILPDLRYIKGTIKSVKPYSSSPYLIEFLLYEDSTNPPRIIQRDISASDIYY